MQLQYYISLQPSFSITVIHNLVIFIWGDPAEGLKQHELTLGYFPDNGDKELIRSITIKDGRVFADDQPLPKLGQVDQSFAGDKWFQVAPVPQAK